MTQYESSVPAHLRKLDGLISQGKLLVAARRNPAVAGKKFADFGDDYERWNLAGKDLFARLVGPSAANKWNYGWCRGMHYLDQDPEYCLREHERQQAMLVALRAELSAELSAETRVQAEAPSEPPKPDGRRLTNKELLADMRRVAKALKKKTVTHFEYEREGRFSWSLFMTRFGVWNKALAAAGLAIAKRHFIPVEELFENMARVSQALGRQPSQTEMVRPLSEFSTGPYRDRFGTWVRALKAFAAWAKDGIIPELADARSKSQRQPSAKLRYEVLLRDAFKCTACGRSPATHPGIHLHLDHILPPIRGGETVYENLTTLCQHCNLGKGTLVDDRLIARAKKRAARRHRRKPGPKRKGRKK